MQPILNELFYTNPINVYVNGIPVENCEKTCDIGETSGLPVTLEFSSDINSCENMFASLTNIVSIDLSSFDVSKITSMKSMFESCENLMSVNFGEFNTSLVVDMGNLFQNCANLNPINVSSFDTSLVTNMKAMFSSCARLTSIDLSNFDTSNVEEMSDIMSYDRQLKYVNLSNFHTPKLREMQGLFYCSEYILYIDMRNFDGTHVTNFKYVFGFLYYVKYINLWRFKVSEENNVTLHETFINTNANAQYCIKDPYTQSIILPSGKTSDCLKICFQKNINVDREQITCECNEQYKNEFKVKCYDECPGNNQTMNENGQYICQGPIPEYYYLDDYEEMYMKCYKTCQRCSQGGNDALNNCEKCIDNYKFLNDSLAQVNNCYIECDYYYYFNETNEYVCTPDESCPPNFKNLILPKKKCIDNCKKDDYNEYICESDNNCLRKCPDNKKTYEDEKLCLDECYPYQFEYNNICYNDCPGDTKRILINRNICIETIPEDYYLDETDNIYKKCYDKCKTCSKGGNEINNNCDECIDNYIFINEPLIPEKNCYIKCDSYYYLNETNDYICTEGDTCPPNYKNTIIPKHKCIDDCKKDDQYIYESDNNCLRKFQKIKRHMKMKNYAWMNTTLINLNIIISVIMIVLVIHIGYSLIEIYILKQYQKIII